jgi:hypothetical protein
LGTFDDDDVSGEVNTPSESSGRDENLNTTVTEEVLDEGTIRSVHTGMMNSETERKEVLEVRVLNGFGFRGEDLASGRIGAEELGDGFVLDGGVAEELGGFGGLFARVDEDDDLVFAGVLEDLFEGETGRGGGEKLAEGKKVWKGGESEGEKRTFS